MVSKGDPMRALSFVFCSALCLPAVLSAQAVERSGRRYTRLDFHEVPESEPEVAGPGHRPLMQLTVL